jgi:hypothetical protein
MTELSPAAQAVFDAAWAETEITPFDREATLRDQIAAALRAAADQLGEELEFYNERVVSVSDLLAIAAELEGAQ